MQQEDNIKSLLKFRIVIFSMNFLAGLSFITAYFFKSNIWFLVAGGVMILAAFGAWFVFTASYNKFSALSKPKD